MTASVMVATDRRRARTRRALVEQRVGSLRTVISTPPSPRSRPRRGSGWARSTTISRRGTSCSTRRLLTLWSSSGRSWTTCPGRRGSRRTPGPRLPPLRAPAPSRPRDEQGHPADGSWEVAVVRRDRLAGENRPASRDGLETVHCLRPRGGCVRSHGGCPRCGLPGAQQQVGGCSRSGPPGDRGGRESGAPTPVVRGRVHRAGRSRECHCPLAAGARTADP